MVAIYATMWDRSEFKVSGETPKEAFANAFKIAGCKTLRTWENIIHNAQLIGHFDNFKPSDHPAVDEVLT